MMKEQEATMYNEDATNEEVPRALETSVLFEPQAIWVLLLFLAVAIWYRFIPLMIISIFLTLLFTIITIWKKISLNHMKATLRLSKSRVFADEEFMLHASIHNDKWLPLVWLEWKFAKSEGIRIGDDKEDTDTIRFLWLLWHQRVKWTVKAKALRRGVYPIGKVTLYSGDGFRFAETKQTYNLGGKLYVYPKLIPIHAPKLPSSLQRGVKGKQGGFMEDPLLVIGVREYQPGDELRRFNWRATSKTGKLQVNVYQPTVMEQVFIYMDVGGFVIKENAYANPVEQKEHVAKKQKAFEGFLSIIASIAVKYKEQGVKLGFITNGLSYKGEGMASIPPKEDLTLFLDQLAQITQQVEARTGLPLETMMHKGLAKSPLYIFCHHVTEDHYRWYQQYRHRLLEVGFYYKEETEYAKHLMTAAKPIDAFLSSIDSPRGES